MGNGLNEPGEYFIGTRVQGNRIIDNVRSAQVFRIMNVVRKVFESHYHDNCLLS